jgi:hypothetical protein
MQFPLRTARPEILGHGYVAQCGDDVKLSRLKLSAFAVVPMPGSCHQRSPKIFEGMAAVE